MYSFKYCVYYTSKASTEHHSIHMPDQEVRKLSSPPAVTRDPSSSPAAYPSPIAGSTGTEAAAASGNETESRGVPSPMDPQCPAARRVCWVWTGTSPGHFGPGPLYAGTPRGSGPISPAALGRRAKVCFYGKGINWALTGNCTL